MQKRLIAVALVLTLLISVSIVYADTKTVTLTYTELNQATTTLLDHYPRAKAGLTVNVTKWTATITHNLQFANSNSGNFTGICLSNANATYPSTPIIKVHFYANGQVRIYYTNETATIMLYQGAYTLPITIKYDNKSINVKDAGSINKTAVLPSPLYANYVLYKTRSDSANSPLLTSGSLTVTLTYDLVSTTIMPMILNIMPLVITIAMFSVALGMISKYTRSR